MRLAPATLGAVCLIISVDFGQQLPQAQRARDRREACVASLSGFPKDVPASPKPLYPADMTGVTLEYNATGCYGNCPAFTLTISKETAVFEGHAYVRAKGKRTAKLRSQQFEALLHAWYDGNFYAMRDDYCFGRCSDGTEIIETDIPASSITLTTPSFKKTVYQCFFTTDNKPETPKPPEQYFQLSQALRVFASSHHWL